jgi:hypothetical protein
MSGVDKLGCQAAQDTPFTATTLTANAIVSP